jgi:hypothetical protein
MWAIIKILNIEVIVTIAQDETREFTEKEET